MQVFFNQSAKYKMLNRSLIDFKQMTHFTAHMKTKIKCQRGRGSQKLAPFMSSVTHRAVHINITFIVKHVHEPCKHCVMKLHCCHIV